MNMRNETAEQMVSIPVVLSKKVDNVLYNLMVRTTTDQVFEGQYTLTEALMTIRRAIDSKASDAEFHKLVHNLEEFFNCTEEDVATLRDIHNFITTSKNADEELHRILTQDVILSIKTLDENQQRLVLLVEDLKNAFDQILINDYVTQTEFNEEMTKFVKNEVYTETLQTINQRIQTLNTTVEKCVTQDRLEEELRSIETQIKETVNNGMITSYGNEAPAELVDGGYWLKIVP